MRGRSIVAAIAICTALIAGSGCTSSGSGTPTTNPSVRIAPNILRDRIIADLDYWAERGIDIQSVKLTSGGSSVEVGTPDPVRVEAALRARYGQEAPLIVREGGIDPL